MDINGGVVGDWIVIGWFTPDYRPLAESFADQLEANGAPYHLFARPKINPGWYTGQKPTMVLEAMQAYPGQTIVLMDVDCLIHGAIDPVTEIGDADVGITIVTGYAPATLGRRLRGTPWQNQLTVRASSRVLVFKPTTGATELALVWREEVVRAAKAGMRGDEVALGVAYIRSTGVRFNFLDGRYSAREIGQMPDAVIEHQSEHSRTKNKGFVWRTLRAIERPFRTGRTRADRKQLQVAYRLPRS